jgi:hypothetical protein
MDKAGHIAQPVGHTFAQIILHICNDDAATFFDKSLGRSPPIPEAPPVTTATLSLMRMGPNPRRAWSQLGSGHHLCRHC